MEKEGQHLAKASFGPTILLSIGKAYERQAAIHLGGFFQGSLVSLKQEGHSIKSKVLLLLTAACKPCHCWLSLRAPEAGIAVVAEEKVAVHVLLLQREK